jgi:hypothetical protein
MQEETSVPQMVTIDINTVSLQDVEAEPGDTMGQVTQIPVEMLPSPPRSIRSGMVGADSINPSNYSTFLRPGEVRKRNGNRIERYLSRTSFSLVCGHLLICPLCPGRTPYRSKDVCHIVPEQRFRVR